MKTEVRERQLEIDVEVNSSKGRKEDKKQITDKVRETELRKEQKIHEKGRERKKQKEGNLTAFAAAS